MLPNHVKPGDLISWEDDNYVVVACSADGTRIVRVDDGTPLWVDLLTLSQEPTFRRVGAVPGNGPIEERVALATLDKQEREIALWWLGHIFEVERGVPEPADPSSKPRPGYDPTVTSLAQRRTLKAKELDEIPAADLKLIGVKGVSAKSIERKQAAYLEYGLHGLVDGRLHRKRSGTRTDPRIESAIQHVLAKTYDQSTVSMRVLRNMVWVHVERTWPDDPESPELNVPRISNKTLDRRFDELDPRRLHKAKATTRRAAGNVPDRPFNPVTVSYPGQVVEIDSTPLDVQVRLNGDLITRPTLTILVDVATKSIIGHTLTAGSPNAQDISELIVRTLRPRQCRPNAPDWMRLSSSPILPSLAMRELDERQVGAIAMPYIVPTSITTDRGKDFLARDLIATFHHFGIDVLQAPPHSPDAKPNVERTFGSIRTMWSMYQEWYLAEATHNRGREMRGEPTDFFDLEDSLTEWIVRVWQNRPHEGLMDPTFPGRRFSPNQMYAALYEGAAAIPVPVDESTYISAMPTIRRTIQADGIQLRSEMYDAPELQPYRLTKSKAPDGKWEVKFDRYDPDRIWIMDQADGSWITCTSRSVRRSKHPWGQSATQKLAAMPAADPGIEDEWARETLHRQAEAGVDKKESVKAHRERIAAQKRVREKEDRGPGPVPVPDLPQALEDREYATTFELASDEGDIYDAR